MPRSRSASPLPRGYGSPPQVRAPHAPLTRRSRQNARNGRQAWTPAEEEIWREMVVKVLREQLVPAVRADGRLSHRGPSLNAHLKAYVSAARGS